MGRRILAAILALTALAVAAFGIPLALSVQDQYRKEAVLRLDREATRAALAVPADFRATGDQVELPRPGGGVDVALYGPDGRLVGGRGPSGADRAVASALQGRISRAGEADGPVVAVPIIADEQVTGVLRAAQPESDVEGRVHRAWLGMLALGVGAISLSALIGLGVSRRIGRPVHTLAGAAERLGEGDFSARVGCSGIGELDTLGAALNATARRLGELLERERAFSADASHQLRTPMAALRVRLEATQLDPAPDHRVAVEGALADLDRLETTVADLLALARDNHADRSDLSVSTLLDEVEGSYHGLLAAQGRRLRIDLVQPLPRVRASAAAVRQVLDVLVGNALDHGSGAVTVRCRPAPGGLAIEVEDEGAGITGGVATIFSRRNDAAEPGRGIGLALARSLAEAEGARLHLSRAAPHPLFSLVLPDSDGGD